MSKSPKKIGCIQYQKESAYIYLDNCCERIECFVSAIKKDRIFEIDFQKLENQITIHYLKVYKTENKGIGTEALNFFEKWATTKGINVLKGELVDGADSSIPSKLIHFYKKNGFDVISTGQVYNYANIYKHIQSKSSY